MQASVSAKGIRKDNPVMKKIGKIALYTVLVFLAAVTLIPFVWMIFSFSQYAFTSSKASSTLPLSRYLPPSPS